MQPKTEGVRVRKQDDHMARTNNLFFLNIGHLFVTKNIKIMSVTETEANKETSFPLHRKIKSKPEDSSQRQRQSGTT